MVEQGWREVLAVLVLTSALHLRGRFRALGTEGQGESSDRERCGAILSQVLGAESPLCHLGATQVGARVQRGRRGWKGRGVFGDKLGIWSGPGWQVSWAPHKNGLSCWKGGG